MKSLHPRRLVLPLLVCAPLCSAQDLYDVSTIRTFELTFQQPDWWDQMRANFELPSRPYIPADLTVDGVAYPNVGVRFRGSSSYYGTGPTDIANPPASAFKKPFKIKMNAFVPGQRLMGYQTVNLNTNFLDPSWVREVLTYQLFRRYVPAPGCNFARLRINGQSWGPYLNTQQINGDLMDQWFADTDGHRYKAKRDVTVFPDFSALLYFGTDITPYDAGFDLKTQSRPDPWLDLIDLCDKLNNTPQAQLPTVLPRVLDVDEALRYMAGCHALVSLDGYTSILCHNFYMVFDDHHKRFSILPWDQNLAFGTGTGGGGSWNDITQADPYFRENEPLRPLMWFLMRQPDWKARFRHYVKTIGREYDWSTFNAELTAVRNLIDPEVQNDPRGLYSYQNFVDNLTQEVTVSWWNPYPTQTQTPVPGLQPFVQGRFSFLQGHPDITLPVNALSNLRLTPARPSPTDPLTFTVRVTGAMSVARVTLHHRRIGLFSETQMFDDGLNGDGLAGDGVYGVILPAQQPGTRLEYFVSMQMTANGAINLIPETGGHQPPFVQIDFLRGTSDVVINEFLASNTNGIRDEVGQLEDWIEMKNIGQGAVDISGMYMTDHLANPTDWVIPANTVLQPGATLLIWADNDAPDGPYHADFKLNAAGEEIYLIDTDAVTILDSVVFGPQLPDVATGRRRDGEQRWVTYTESTPDATNEIASCGKRRFSFVDPTLQPIDLDVQGVIQLGQSVTYRTQGGPASSLHAVFVDVYTSTIPLWFSESILMLGPIPFAFLSGTSDALGATSMGYTIPNDNNLLGRSFYFQGFALDGSGIITGSNVVELVYCP